MSEEAINPARSRPEVQKVVLPARSPAVRYPDFLVIGAQKSATTWLHRHLRRHPEVWIPVIKEVHYFDDLAARRERLKTHRSPVAWAKGLRHRQRLIRKSLGSWYRRGFSDTSFWWRYAFGAWNDAWYGRLFAPAKPDQVVGELTPAYATLGREQVEHVHSLMPHARIIFLLRNPIHRTWSAMRMMNVSSQEGVDPDSREAWAPFVESDATRLRSDYLRTLTIWEAAFSPEQVLVGFYEEVKSDPEALLARVCRFIGVSHPLPSSGEVLRDQVNVSERAQMPPGLKRYLAELYYPDLVQLHQRFGGPTEHWLREAEDALSQ